MTQEDKAHIINMPNPPMPHCNASEIEIKEALNSINSTLEEIKAVQHALGLSDLNATSRLLRSINANTDTGKSVARQTMYSNNTFATYANHILKKLDTMQLYSANEALRNNKVTYDKLGLIEDSVDHQTPWLALIAVCSAITAISSVIIAIHS